MKRIGILGGTFNPPHIGHLAIAQMAKEKMCLDKVIFVPSNLPPHKSADGVAAPKHRLAMTRLSVAKNSSLTVSEFEIKKKGKSYSVDTMRYFRKKFSRKVELFFIIGGDALSQLEKWKYIKDLVKITTFIVVNRPGRFKKKTWIKHNSVSMPGIDISSSYVRQRIAQGKTVKYFVPDNVIRYIKRNKLYAKK